MSVRTIYRDIADLQAAQVPIDGERGVGYILRDDYFLPPLRLSPIEREALAWGVAFVKAHGDPEIAAAATEVEIKLSSGGQARPATLPLVFAAQPKKTERQHQKILRIAIARRQKLALVYGDAHDSRTARTVRPLSLEHWGSVWTLTTWCETRADFRVFRIDRIVELHALADVFVPEAGKTMADFIARLGENTEGQDGGPAAPRQMN